MVTHWFWWGSVFQADIDISLINLCFLKMNFTLWRRQTVFFVASYLRDRGHFGPLQRQKVRDGFEITTTVPLQVQKSKPGSEEQVQSEQVSVPGGEGRPQSVCGQEKTRLWTGTVWQQGLQRWLSWPASASAQGPSRFQERLGGRQETWTTETREQCERSIIKVTVFTGWFDSIRFFNQKISSLISCWWYGVM